MKNLRYLLRTFSYQELAELLGYNSRSTIHHWIKNKSIPKRSVGLVTDLANRIRKIKEANKKVAND